MFESLRTSHEEKVQKLRAYDKAELETRRNEEAYKSFKRKPYYLEDREDECRTGD